MAVLFAAFSRDFAEINLKKQSYGQSQRYWNRSGNDVFLRGCLHARKSGDHCQRSGNRTTPSYVAFTDSERLIGDAAKNQVAMNLEHCLDANVLSVARFSDTPVQQDMKHGVQGVQAEGGRPKIKSRSKVKPRRSSAEEISSMCSRR
uniref:Uncharacterized protein n=1 Tax=Ditylenchus dipsaci TaxID=166011 RepID=A0A915DK01_9BILA